MIWKRPYRQNHLIPPYMDAGTSTSAEETQPLMTRNTVSSITADEGLIPRLFTSLPALDDATSYLTETTTFFTSCLPRFSEQNVERNSLTIQPVLAPSSFDQTRESLSRIVASNWISSSHSASTQTTSAATQYDITGTASPEVTPVNSSTMAELASTSNNQNDNSIFRGLIERVRRTVRGSVDDIGWLKRDPEMPPVEDGTERFMEILDSIGHGVHRLPTSMVYLLIPGLFSNHGPLYFTSTKTRFSKMGLACHIAKIHSEASVEKNARELKEYIEEIYWGSEKRVMLLGHSKGGIDAAAALSMYWPDLKDKVAGLVFAQSPYGGSPIASDILREGQLGDYVNVRKLMEILICKVIKGDMQALEDLTYEKRREFLKKYKLPKELPTVSFHTQAKITPAVLATLSHVAHAELGQAAKVPIVMPLGAVMGACAQLLQVRYGEKSDGLVTRRDAEVPGSVVVQPERNLDHAWMVYSSFNDNQTDADASQVCEALLELLLEVEQKKRHEIERKNE